MAELLNNAISLRYGKAWWLLNNFHFHKHAILHVYFILNAIGSHLRHIPLDGAA